ncbi:hypothetical protein Fmac_024489 [Flemingia macrophylla]|uniref:Uncharacterized protein n=1 Tax=Flemingia macrophylla TaxID=520843 RepID=A0ABD1LPM6_9FABA
MSRYSFEENKVGLDERILKRRREYSRIFVKSKPKIGRQAAHSWSEKGNGVY